MAWVEEKKKKEYVRVHMGGENHHQGENSRRKRERERERESRKAKAGFSNLSILKVTTLQYPGWNR